MIRSHLKLILLAISLVFIQIQTVSSNEEWVVNDIRITGLQRAVSYTHLRAHET